MTSILNTIKKMVGITESDTSFDTDIIIHINSALMVLNQLNVGPEAGYFITSATETWDNYLGTDKDIESVKTLIYLKVRLAFDPPTNAFLVEAMKAQIKEHEWRLMLSRDEKEETDEED